MRLAWYLLNFGGTATRQSYSGHTNDDQKPGMSNELTSCECNVTIMHFDVKSFSLAIDFLQEVVDGNMENQYGDIEYGGMEVLKFYY